jgi:transcription antitermination factor NusG
LIRGYVFVRVSRKEFYEVLITSGVLWYVCFDNKPAVIEDNQIESLRRFVENGQSDIQVTSEEIRMGDLVRIIDGALKNLYAEVVHIRGKSRLLLRFTNLGCCVHVEIGAH